MGSSRTRNSTRAAKARPAKSAPAPSPQSPAPAASELARELESIALKLRGIYSTGLTIKLAIEGLDGEHDADIAYCLGWNVLDPVAAQLEQLNRIVVTLGGDEIALL